MQGQSDWIGEPLGRKNVLKCHRVVESYRIDQLLWKGDQSDHLSFDLLYCDLTHLCQSDFRLTNRFDLPDGGIASSSRSLATSSALRAAFALAAKSKGILEDFDSASRGVEVAWGE